VDTPKKPQASDEDEAPAEPVPAPAPSLQTRNPFRPLSRRRRQLQMPEPPPAVERPSTSLVFDASPTTLAAALAKAGASPAESSLAWRGSQDSDPDLAVEIEPGDDGGAGTVSP